MQFSFTYKETGKAAIIRIQILCLCIFFDTLAVDLAAGDPCKVIRTIDKRDKKYYDKGCKITAGDLEEEHGLR